MIHEAQMAPMYLAFRSRWLERDDRMKRADDAVRGDWHVVDPDDDELESRSPNMIQVALEDTAEAASYQPTVRVMPSKPTKAAKDSAYAMEQMAASYLQVSRMPLVSISSYQKLAGFGVFVWTVTYDKELKSPVIRERDPRTFYPEPGWQPGDSIRTCLFTREVYLRQLPTEWQSTLKTKFGQVWQDANSNDPVFNDQKITLVEFYEEDVITIGALFAESTRGPWTGPATSWTPCLLEQFETPGGICPVVAGQRISLDNEPRGQFDQVIPVQQAHIRLMAMVLDYSDQAVYSDIWVKDLIGQMSYGGGAYIQLGPNGQIGRVPPAVSSLDVQRDLSQMSDYMHLGGRWPKTRPGEIDQSIASAKFVEATAGMMNTVIRTYHLIMQEALERALNTSFKIDKLVGPERVISGVLKNQQFRVERSASDIDLEAIVKVDYGIGFGRDPAQTLVLGIQGVQTGMWSNAFVQENFDGLSDIQLERERIDISKLTDMAFAQLLQGLQTGTIPPDALPKIAAGRAKGEDILELFEKYIVKPQQEQQEQAYTSGLTGQQVMPGGAPPGAGGPMPPAPPDAAGLLGALAGGGGPGGPGGAETINRLNVPLGGGSFAGSTVKR
jgi:hypothetical protein